VSDRLLFDDLYTSLHIERYDLHIEETEREKVKITRKNEFLSRAERACLDKDRVIRVGRWVETGDLLVSRVVDIEKRRLSGYQRLAYEILRKNLQRLGIFPSASAKWIEGRIIEVEKSLRAAKGPKKLVSVRLYLVEKKRFRWG
jgi:DNA-directed RNA polymerase subunit beta